MTTQSILPRLLTDFPLTLAQAGGEGAVQQSSGNFVWAGIVVATLFGGALYAICRSSRR